MARGATPHKTVDFLSSSSSRSVCGCALVWRGVRGHHLHNDRHRHLTLAERTNAVGIFYDSIDYGAVRVSRGSPLALVSATAIGNTINLRSEHFVGNTMELSPTGRLVLVHELAHVWQYQSGGFAYIRSSLFAQMVALIFTGSRRAAYDWRRAHNASQPWNEWNAEQQAECISHYHVAFLCRDRNTMRTAFPYIKRVRRRSRLVGAHP